MSVLFPTKLTLTGQRVVLRPFGASDIEAMGPILADPDVIRLTGSAHTTAETLAASAGLDARTRSWYETRVDQSDRLDLAIVDRESDRCVGEAVLNEWSEADDSCNFRILVGPAGRDRGLGSEATRLLVDYAFQNTTLNRIELGVYAFNPRALRVYGRAGFVDEGRRRDALKFDGEYIDEIVMAVLRADWESRPAG